MVPASALAQRRSFSWVAVLLATALLAVLLGLVGAVAGWFAQVLILSVALPFVLLLVDYRLGLALVVLFLPYAGSPMLPKAGPLSLINVLLLGVCASFVLRWALMRMVGRQIVIPVTREFIGLYFVVVTAATLIGTLHLGEIPRHFVLSQGFESYGLKEYWISFYFKMMLLVIATVCVMGAAVVENGKGLRFAVLSVISGVLFVFAVFAVIAASGASLDHLRHIRNFLRPLGMHNNEAGLMLFWPLAMALFMREFVQHKGARMALFVAVLIIGTGVLFTFSRGAFVAMVTVTAFYVWHYKRLRAGLMVLTVAVIGVALAPDAVRDRLMTGLDGGSVTEQFDARYGQGADELTAGRVYIWTNLAPEVVRSPLIGRGMESGMWSQFIKDGNLINNPHSLYLRLLMDLGIVGAMCMLFFYRYVWKLFRRMSNDSRLEPAMRGYFLGAAAGMLGMLASGVAGGTYYPANYQLFFWVAVGLGLAYSRRLAGQPAVAVDAPTPGSSTMAHRHGHAPARTNVVRS